MTKRVDPFDYLGNTYEDLTVVGYEYSKPNNKGSLTLIANCSCGQCGIRVLPYRIGTEQKSCGCRRKKPHILKPELDLVGRVFSELTVIGLHPESRELKKGKARQWICKCSCGSEAIVAGSNLKSGDTKSCGHLKHVAYNKKHGKFRTKVYSAWKNAITRCYDDSYSSTDRYKGRGIVMADEFLRSFEAFYEYIGDPPTENHTLERINVNGNYERGNITWVLLEFQARNKAKSSRNTTGITGVSLSLTESFGRAVASWREWDEVKQKYLQKSKSFSFNKYGEDRAFALAVQYREQKIKELNSLGYGYSENHGK